MRRKKKGTQSGSVSESGFIAESAPMNTKGVKKARRQKRHKKHSRHFRYLIACVGLLLFGGISFGVYYLSDNTVVQALLCTGNFYYTPQQIYRIAGLSVNSRAMMYPPVLFEKALEADPLIKDATITKDGRRILISVDEEMVIGYYTRTDEKTKETATYMVLEDGSTLPIDELTQGIMAYFPYLGSLSDEQIQMLCQEVQKHPEELTRTVFEKIAEIQPWEESYDKTMLKITMQDGNTVFTDYNSLFMLSQYQTCLSNLEGTNVCLVLDGNYGVISKQACSYLYMDPEERAGNRTVPKSVFTKESEEENKEESNKEDSNKEGTESPSAQADAGQNGQNAQPADTQSQENVQPAANDTANTAAAEQSSPDAAAQNEQENLTAESSRVEADDWQECSYSWLLYSPSTGVYQEKYGDGQYIYDETIKAFSPLQ